MTEYLRSPWHHAGTSQVSTILVSSDIEWSQTSVQHRTTWLNHVLQFYVREIFRIAKSTLKECRLVVARGYEEKEMGNDCLMGTKYYFGVTKMFWN